MQARDGLHFFRLPEGSIRIVKYADGNSDSPVVGDVTMDQHTWASIIANMSYYGEEDYGYYRALNFHNGHPLHKTTPIKDKPPLW